ncbi:Cysteine-rich TM module stress tolerance protein [Arachis hypogaea]|nr:Cysteine-rich TM module stress tolerance protein [Arachis hypogaea]
MSLSINHQQAPVTAYPAVSNEGKHAPPPPVGYPTKDGPATQQQTLPVVTTARVVLDYVAAVPWTVASDD